MPCVRTRIVQAGRDALHHRFERNPAVSMRLWIEEYLGVTNVVRRRPPQVCAGEVVEVSRRAQDARAFVVDIEKRLEIPEVVCPAKFGRGAVIQMQPIARG